MAHMNEDVLASASGSNGNGRLRRNWMVLSSGAGAEMRHAMGIAVFFGMLGVTFFGLFLTPVFYVLLRTLEKRVTGRDKPTHHGAVAMGEV